MLEGTRLEPFGAVDRERDSSRDQERASGHLRSLALMPTRLRVTHPPTKKMESDRKARGVASE